MNVQTKASRLANYSAVAVGWMGRAAILFLLIAVLGFTQNLYGVDVRVGPNAPVVQVRVVVFNSMQHGTWRRFVNFTRSLFHSSPSREEACAEGKPRRQVC